MVSTASQKALVNESVNWRDFVHWVFAPTSFLETQAQRFGSAFRKAIIAGNPQAGMWFVSDPASLQTVLSQDTSVFSTPGELNSLLKPLVGDRSMILLSGQEHRRARKLLMPPFHGERMRQYGDEVMAIAHQVSATLQPGQTLIARKMMQDITLQIIMEVVFGVRSGDRQAQMQPLLARLLDMTGSPLRASLLFFQALQQPFGPWKRFLDEQAALDALIYAEIAERRGAGTGDRHDVLSLMLEARDENGEALSDQELRDELITLLTAGHETTATALAWAFYWIHRDEQVRSKLLAELDALPADAEPMDIFRLPYLTAVCNETLRIYPVAMLTFPRQACEPVTLAGHTLQPGENVMGVIYLAHRNPEVFPNPEVFRPERFLERQYSPYEFLPFGGGNRRCLGLALAQFEMKLVLAHWLRSWTFELAESRPVQPQRRGLTLGPKTGVRMRAVARRS